MTAPDRFFVAVEQGGVLELKIFRGPDAKEKFRAFLKMGAKR